MMKRMMMIGAALLLTAACNRNTDPVSNVVEASEDPGLQQKNFTSKCSITPIDAIVSGILTGGDAAMKSTSTVYRFQGEGLTRTTNIYESSDCSGEVALVFTETGKFDILDDNQTPEGARLVNFGYEKVTLKVQNAKGVEAANALSLCGTNNWVDNQEADVTTRAADLTCYNATVPRLVANIYKLEGSILYLGTPSKDGVGEASRPTSLDRNQAYIER
ncbi:MAG: hypothetical protein KF767_18295 [Bdellovibrionaceae bacterium]|nr:hypothetical protein [Pseudobdellovibrionaceae bacterium]